MLIIGSDTAIGGTILGIKTGIGFTNWNDTNYRGAEYKTGFNAGGFVAFGITEMFEIQPEALYTQEGMEEPQIATDEGGEEAGIFMTKYNFDYLKLPVLAKYYFPGRKVHLFAGGAISFKLSSKIKNCASDQFGDTGTRNEIELEGYKSTDLSAMAGAGVDIPVGNGKIILDARYNHGLTDIHDDGDEHYFLSAKNSGFMIMVGYGW